MANREDSTVQKLTGHGERVGLLSCWLGEKLQIPKSNLPALYVSGRWHDIGKLMLPFTILNKPGKLTDFEFDKVKNHPKYSVDILRKQPFGDSVLNNILHHHEDWCGTGYPDKLKGNAIPLGSQIVRICDVFDALVMARVYKEAIHPIEAIKLMDEDCTAMKYNPEIYNIFKDNYVEVLQYAEAICNRISDNCTDTDIALWLQYIA